MVGLARLGGGRYNAGMRIIALLALALSLHAAEEIRADNIAEWGGKAGPSASSTRTATTVTVYARKGDQQRYYIVTERRDEASAVKMDIDGISYGIAQTGIRVVKCKAKTFNDSPVLTLSQP